MSSTAPSTARLFFLQGPSWSVENDDGGCKDALNFTELPPLPIASAAAARHADGGATAARPLVSPMLHLGRQSPLLRSALHNDRRWSRKLIEVTTWCIEGLPLGAGLCPVDAAALPFAGVRLRLCGHGGPLHIRSRGASEAQRTIALSEPGACAWLRHGDVVDFGGGVQVLFVVVQVRTSPARDLADHASFVWVQPGDATVTAAPTPAAPVAMWSARYGEWSTVPRFLKTKMLAEAAQLALQALRQDEARSRLSAAASTKAPSSVADKETESQSTTSAARAPRDPFLSPAQREHDVDGVDGGSSSSSSRSSATQPDACAEQEASDVEAATPTSTPQQQQQHHHHYQRHSRVSHSSTATSPQSLTDRRQTRSAPEMLEDGAEGRATTLAMRPASQGRSPAVQRVAGSGLHSHASLRVSAHVGRYSAATLSDTLDDKLQEALFNLENGGNELGEALVLQQQQQQRPGLSQHTQHGATVLLGGLEEELTASRVFPAGGGVSQGRVPPQAQDGASTSDNPAITRTSIKRGTRGKTAIHAGDRGGRRSGSRRSVDEADGDGGGTSSAAATRRRRRALSTSVSLSQPQQAEGSADGVAAPPLTRADIKRQRTRQSALEDSQVVFFDH